MPGTSDLDLESHIPCTSEQFHWGKELFTGDVQDQEIEDCVDVVSVVVDDWLVVDGTALQEQVESSCI